MIFLHNIVLVSNNKTITNVSPQFPIHPGDLAEQLEQYSP